MAPLSVFTFRVAGHSVNVTRIIVMAIGEKEGERKIEREIKNSRKS